MWKSIRKAHDKIILPECEFITKADDKILLFQWTGNLCACVCECLCEQLFKRLFFSSTQYRSFGRSFPNIKTYLLWIYMRVFTFMTVSCLVLNVPTFVYSIPIIFVPFFPSHSHNKCVCMCVRAMYSSRPSYTENCWMSVSSVQFVRKEMEAKQQSRCTATPID